MRSNLPTLVDFTFNKLNTTLIFEYSYWLIKVNQLQITILYMNNNNLILITSDKNTLDEIVKISITL